MQHSSQRCIGSAFASIPNMPRRGLTHRAPRTSAATILIGFVALQSFLPAFVGIFSSSPVSRDFRVVRSAAPAILDNPITKESETDAPEGAAGSDKNKTASNATLQLSSGIPEIGNSQLGKGPSWAKCIVEQRTSGDQGSTRILLEEWVMRGERENVNAFRSWRQGGTFPATARCSPTSLLSTESVSCLACVPRFSALNDHALPFTPQGHAHIPDSQWALDGPGLKPDAIITFSGLQQCMSTSFGSGFCKSGSVTI